MKRLISLSTLLTLLLLLSSCDAPLGDAEPEPKLQHLAPSTGHVIPQLSSGPDTLVTITWRGKQTPVIEDEIAL